MGAASNRKGATFERAFCKALSESLSDGVNSYLFRRSAMSGGVATVKQNKKGSSVFAGDICASVEEASSTHSRRALAFVKDNCVELKNRKDLSFDPNFITRLGQLNAIWYRQKKISHDVRKTAILCYNDRVRGKWVMVNMTRWQYGESNKLLSCLHRYKHTITAITRANDDDAFYFMPLSLFLDYVKAAYR